MNEYDKDCINQLEMQDSVYDHLYGHSVKYIMCQCSTAHTFGNVTAYIQKWLLDLFPDETFKTIHVNSKIAHTQLRSTPKEILKKSPPMLILRPRIEWNDSSRFLNGTMLIQRQGDLYHTYGGTNLQDFFQDNVNKVAIKYQLNRHVMNFDVVLIFNTLMQQINWSNYILNAVRCDIPFTLSTCLESYISPELLHILSHTVSFPKADEPDGLPDFLRYMNAHSLYPITYKMQGSTQTEEFYRYYPVNIDTIMTNFSTDEGEKVGHIQDRYQISFSLRCEFYGTGFYYLFSDKVHEHTILTVDKEDSSIIPVFTDVLTADDINLPMGWQLYASPSCRLEYENDSVCIEPLINDSIKAAIRYHIEHGIPMVEFFKIRVRKQGKLLYEGKDYLYDPETFTIKFKSCNTYYTYKILIMLNIEYINNLVKEVYNLQ